MVLIIIHWNARSLIANGQEFNKFIDDLVEKPNVIYIQETWIKPQLDFIIKGYNVVTTDREPGRVGGVATFIQSGMKYQIRNRLVVRYGLKEVVWILLIIHVKN